MRPFPAPERGFRWLMLALAIVPLWLVTRNLFDGATTAHAELTGDYEGLYYWTVQANWPLALLYYKASATLAGLLHVPVLLPFKLAVTACLLGLYVEFARLARDLFNAGETESHCIALLALCSPSLYTLVSSSISPILLCVWLMFAGHALYRGATLGRRLAGLVVLALSFQLASNLVMALALEVAFLFLVPAQRRARLPWFALLFATAVTVYFTMRVLAPPKQLYLDYNVLLNPLTAEGLRRIAKATAMFLTWGVIPMAAVLLALAAGAAAGRGQPLDRAALRDANAWKAILACAFLCAAAAFPYVMVGKGPPLFTLRSFGEGVTEQVLRAAHTGLFAPTWPNTSGRHAMLYAVGIAFLSWHLAALVLRVMGASAFLARPLRMGVLLAPLFLAWMLPAYYNKLHNQHTEESLRKALAAMPPAPAGVVELRYAPVTDYVIWGSAAGVVLHQAWGRSDYYAMFHSVPAALADMQWGYHAYLAAAGPQTALMQNFMGMKDFPGPQCQTRYEAQLPQPAFFDVVLGGVWDARVQPAKVTMLESGCNPANTVPNPTPEKKLIP